MKGYAKIKTAFDLFVGIVSLLGFAVSLWSAWIAYQTTRKAQEIVREVYQYYHDTVIEHQRDTVYVKVPEPVMIDRKETVYFPLIYNPDTGNTAVLSNAEIDSIRKHREDFLEGMERMKGRRAK